MSYFREVGHHRKEYRRNRLSTRSVGDINPMSIMRDCGFKDQLGHNDIGLILIITTL